MKFKLLNETLYTPNYVAPTFLSRLIQITVLVCSLFVTVQTELCNQTGCRPLFMN